MSAPGLWSTHPATWKAMNGSRFRAQEGGRLVKARNNWGKSMARLDELEHVLTKRKGANDTSDSNNDFLWYNDMLTMMQDRTIEGECQADQRRGRV